MLTVLTVVASLVAASPPDKPTPKPQPKPTPKLTLEMFQPPDNGGCVGWSVKDKMMLCVTVVNAQPSGVNMPSAEFRGLDGSRRDIELAKMDEDHGVDADVKRLARVNKNIARGGYTVPPVLWTTRKPASFVVPGDRTTVRVTAQGVALRFQGVSIRTLRMKPAAKGYLREVTVYGAGGWGVGVFVREKPADPDDDDELPLDQKVAFWPLMNPPSAKRTAKRPSRPTPPVAPRCSYCPPHTAAVREVLGAFCDNKVDDAVLTRLRSDLGAGRMTVEDLRYIYNMYGASFGFTFKKYPKLNTFYYDAGRAALPVACQKLVRSFDTMGKVPKWVLKARTQVLRVLRAHKKGKR